MKYSLSVTQTTRIGADGVTLLSTKLRHSSGEWFETRARLMPVKNDPQTQESELNHTKRNQLKTLLGLSISGDDDDAERAMANLRDVKAHGTAINTKYDPKDQSHDTISPDQREELEYELSEYPDIAEMVLGGLKIHSIADMPKSKYMVSLLRIREIKRLRNEGK